MKYIIMCGGKYQEWETPRQLLKVNGEEIVARTIRLLYEEGITDIAISTDNPAFDKFGVPILHHENNFCRYGAMQVSGHWVDCFYPTNEPVCYILGDVVFSPEAIKTIVDTQTDDVEMFGSAKPFPPEYSKEWVENFAFKVVNQTHFQETIRLLKDISITCWRPPIAWELWALLKGRRIDIDDYKVDYTVINDYTCDIDHPYEISKIERIERQHDKG